jgi:hypothetical protein
MAYFPQLDGGTSVQLPLRYWRRFEAGLLEREDGGAIVVSGATRGEHGWDLQYRGLRGAEADRLVAFFSARQGRLLPFGFLDPVRNLLAWSEDLTKAHWQRDALIQVLSGAAGPAGMGTAQTVLNSGQAVQSVWQTLPVPGIYRFAMSVFLRSGAADVVRLWAENSGVRSWLAVEPGASWGRFEFPVEPGGTEEITRFGMELEPGAAVEVFGVQLEPQGGAGPYKRSAARQGVYVQARFDMDEILLSAEGKDSFGARVRIVAREGAE